MLTPAVARLFVAFGSLVTLVQSASIAENDKQQVTMNNEEEFSDISHINCDDGRVANCRTLPLFNYTELAPPENADAAGDILQDPNCPYKHIERHLRCVDLFTRRCLTTDQRRSFYSMYSVPTMGMQELCNVGSPYREEYRKHAVCLHTVHTEYVKCGRLHQHELDSLISDHSQQQQQQQQQESNKLMPITGSEQITLNLVHLCRSFKGYLQCVNGIVKATCGPETEDFANRTLSQMASSLLNICYKYGDLTKGDDSESQSSGTQCTTGSMTRGTSVLRIVAAVAVLLVTAYQ